MKNQKIKTDAGGKFLTLLENILFVCCVVVIVLRATFTEAPTPQSSQIQAAINDAVYSLALSAILIFSFLLLFLVRLFSGRFSFRLTPMQIGLVIFLVAAILSCLYASNKRAAITASLTLLAPLLMTALLAKLLDSHAKIKILLIVIVALGLIQSWQSADQFFISNQIMLQEYQDDPNSILQPLGIRPGTLEQMMLEHRIYSKDVRASFTTSNSAGSFAILASFAAIALLAELLKNRKSSTLSFRNLLLAGILLAVVLFGLFITRSKGAIASFLLALAVFILLLRSKRPKLSKNVVLAACVFTVLVLIPFVAWFGLKFGRLPGGNSMLVRWQYWRASAQMFADQPLTGVGPGNFNTLYHLYKPPSAPETVSDPHCFVLSILTQYGFIGLIGFLLCVLAPLYRSSISIPLDLDKSSGPKFIKLAVVCTIAPVVAMLLLRPFIIPASTATTFDEKFYVLIVDFIAPAAAFAVGIVLLIKSLQTTRPGEYETQNTSVTAIALFAALLGFLIHNLIDFAIFEPGILTAFCAVLACFIALDSQTQPLLKSKLASSARPKIEAAIVVLVIFFAYFNYALLPVAKSTAKIAKARLPLELGGFQLAHNLLADATDDDPLSPDAPATNGRLCLQYLHVPNIQQTQVLQDAENALFFAAQRNPDDYKNFDTLTDVYSSWAKLQPEQKNQSLAKALDSASAAVSLYPGDAELHFRLAQIAEDLARPDTALKHYQIAVQIEDDFRSQFHRMYPRRKVLSRMPLEEYLLAKNRAKILSEKTPESK